MKLLFQIFLILFMLPLLAHSQDTSKIANGLMRMANPESTGISAKEASEQIGSEVYVRDSMFNYKIINKSNTVLYVGDRNSDKALNIIIKRNKIKINPKDWKNSLGHFSGKVIIYKGKPTIVITEPAQLGTIVEI